jgi:SAM-dependent methyltransferase
MTQSDKIFDRQLLLKRRKSALARDNYPNFVDKIVAEELVMRLSLIKRQFERCVILVPASDAFLRKIASAPQVECIIAADQVDLDCEWLPFKDDSIDCFIAPPGLEQVNDLAGVLVQVNRALKPDGLFLAAMFGGETLNELRHAWLVAEQEMYGGVSPRVAPFADIRQTGNLLQRAGLALPVSDSERLTVRYGDANELMWEIKRMGFSNALVGRQRKPTGKAVMKRVRQIYNNQFADLDGRVRATLEINYLTGWCPHESQQKPLKPGSARKKLADFL